MDAVLDFVHQSAFYEFAALLFLVAAFAYLSHLVKQPLIFAYIAVGILASPEALGLISTGDQIELLAKLGITLLLFIVGLKLDLKLIKSLGIMSLVIGGFQMVATIGGGYLLCRNFGYDQTESLFIGIALAFSSTIVIVKILSDKREIDSLHGRITLGVLIIQDFAVVLTMMVLATLSSANSATDSTQNLIFEILKVSGYAVLFICFVAFFARYVAKILVRQMARLPELLLCFALAWAVLFAALCDYLGLSKELGGLLAGISLASTPYREAIVARLASLRDFLLLFFFLALGSHVKLSGVGDELLMAIVLSLFVLTFKPLSVLCITRYLGYRKRTGFLSGISLAQISEFSLIFIAMSVSLQMIDESILTLITLTTLITIAVSTYGISTSHKVFEFVEPLLNKFKKKRSQTIEDTIDTTSARKKYDIVLFGMGNYGSAIVESLKKKKFSILIVDFNPDVIRYCKTHKLSAMYGDAGDTDFYHSIPLNDVKWVVSAMPQKQRGVMHEDPNFAMIDALKENKYKGKIAVATNDENSIQYLRRSGANVVFLPFHDAAERAVNLMVAADKKQIVKQKKREKAKKKKTQKK